MLQLAFSSTMIEPMTDGEIDDLIGQCRTYNLEAGITGSMIVGGNRFAEIIEGGFDEVTSAFGRICRDKRHHAIVLLGRRETDRRLFPDTPLAYEKIAPLGTMMSLAQMARMLRGDTAHESILRPLRRYASVLTAA